MSAAPSWPLISSPALGAPSGTRLPPLPGLNFSNPLWGPKIQFQAVMSRICSSDLQNAKRRAGRIGTPARHNDCLHGLQKPEIACSPNGLQGLWHPCPPRFRAVDPIWGDNSGDSRGIPSNPHTFSCSACIGTIRRTPFASGPSFLRDGPRPRALARDPASKLCLLEFDLRASLLELDLELLGLVLVHAFLDRLRRALDEVLCFLQAQAGDGADFLDDLDLLVAGGGKNDRELGLLFGRSGGSGGGTGNGHCRSGGHAPLFFEELGEFGGFEHGEAREVVNDFLQVSHCSVSLN